MDTKPTEQVTEKRTRCLRSDPGEFLSIVWLSMISGETKHVWRKRILRREIPYVKFGSNVRVRRADLEAWIAARTIPAIATEATDCEQPAASTEMA